MDRHYVTFLFREGDAVYWRDLQGIRYIIRAQRYEKGDAAARYTVYPPGTMPSRTEHSYLLYNPQNILGDFWALEQDLSRVEEHV